MVAIESPFTTSWRTAADNLSDRQRTMLRGALALVDQGVASGTNFATTVIVGRTCLPEELGHYALGFSVLVALLGLPRSLIWTPYVRFFPQLAAADRRTYTGSVHLIQFAICLLVGAVLSAVGGLLIWRNGPAGFGPVCVVLGPAIAITLGREHIRRVCFARLQIEQALLVDAATSALQLSGLLLMAMLGYLTATTAWVVIALACVPVVIAWTYLSRGSWQVDSTRLRPDSLRNWSYARWLLGEAGIQAITDMWYPWALLLFWGTATVGKFSAAQGIVYLANPLLMALANFLAPHAAHVLADSGATAMRRMLSRYSALVALPMAAITLLITFGSEPLIGLIFGSEYRGAGPIMSMLSLALWADSVAVPFYAGNVALGHGKSLVVAVLLRMTCATLLGTPLVAWYGALGVGYTLIVSHAIAGTWLWWALRAGSNAPEVPA